MIFVLENPDNPFHAHPTSAGAGQASGEETAGRVGFGALRI